MRINLPRSLRCHLAGKGKCKIEREKRGGRGESEAWAWKERTHERNVCRWWYGPARAPRRVQLIPCHALHFLIMKNSSFPNSMLPFFCATGYYIGHFSAHLKLKSIFIGNISTPLIFSLMLCYIFSF